MPLLLGLGARDDHELPVAHLDIALRDFDAEAMRSPVAIAILRLDAQDVVRGNLAEQTVDLGLAHARRDAEQDAAGGLRELAQRPRVDPAGAGRCGTWLE